ncbi:MAG: hypothetical protein WAM94_15460 [Chromatiaceae bacterium]
MYPRSLFVALAVTVALSACSFDRVFGRGDPEATPTAGSAGSGTSTARAGTSVSPEKAMKAAKAAVASEVVVKPGQYLLCSITDKYKERTTSYFTCRERRCAGPETPAADVKPFKSRTGCMNACRKVEKKNLPDAKVRAYCAS